MRLQDRIDAIFNKPKLIDFYNIFHQLHMLIQSGATMQQSLLDIAPLQEKTALKTALFNVSRSLGMGLPLGAAFRKESVFPKVVSPTLDAGFKAGQVSGALNQLAEMMYLQDSLYSKVKTALFVPKCSAVIMALMTIAYIKLAVPEFLQLYQENNMEVPFLLSFVTDIVNTIVDFWFITIPLCILAYKLWCAFARSHVALIDGWKLRIPIYKKLHYVFLQHQFASIISMMLGSGLTAPDALSQVQKVVENCHMADEIGRVRADMLKGLTFTDALKRNNGRKIFDPMLIASCNAGERSSNLSNSLGANCKYYERTLYNLIDPVSTKLTIIVLIPMGALIIAMYMFTMIPVFSYVSQVK